MEDEVMTEQETETSVATEAADEAEDYSAEIDETEYDDTEDEDFELDYDDDGSVIIPDDEPEEEGDTTPQAEAAESAADPAPAASADTRNSRAGNEELERFRALAKDALKKLGYDEEDPEEGLLRIAAEASGQSVEEYREEHRRKSEENTARIREAEAALARMKAEDIAAVHAAVPASAKYTSIDDFPNAQLFMDLRDLGHSPADAFSASHPEDMAAAVKQGARDSKAHLRSNVPRGAKDTSLTISKAQLAEYREMFPGRSDKELVSLYRRATKNN